MATEERGETLEAFDGLELYCEVYAPQQQQGVIVALHDFGEHVGLYRKAYQRLVSAGYKVYTFDLRGHGKSPGDRAYIEDFDDFLEDVDLLWARVSDRESQSRDKVFLLGQGMGALIALRFALSRKPHARGLILSNMLTDLPLRPMERQLTRIPGLWFSHKPFAEEAGRKWLQPTREGHFKDDPLAYRGPLAFATVRAVLGACRQTYKEAQQMPCSLLVLQGQHPLSDSTIVASFHEETESFDKQIFTYQGASANLLVSGIGDQALGDIIEWCDQKVQEPLPQEDDEDERDEENDAI